MMENSFKFKIITAGDGGVGKTTLLRRYIEGKFSFDTKMTVGVDIYHKVINLDGNIVCSLQLWDLGGQEMFRTMLDNFATGAHGGFLMYDLTNYSSFDNLLEWLTIARKEDDNLPILLIGAKNDLKDSIEVDDDDALEFVEKYKLNGLIKVSSKTGYNVDKVFKTLSSTIIKYKGLSSANQSVEI